MHWASVGSLPRRPMMAASLPASIPVFRNDRQAPVAIRSEPTDKGPAGGKLDEKGRHCDAGGLHGIGAGQLEFLCSLEPGRCRYGLPSPPQARGSRRRANKGNGSVSEVEQIADRLQCTGFVVDQDSCSSKDFFACTYPNGVLESDRGMSHRLRRVCRLQDDESLSFGRKSMEASFHVRISPMQGDA